MWYDAVSFVLKIALLSLLRTPPTKGGGPEGFLGGMELTDTFKKVTNTYYK